MKNTFSKNIWNVACGICKTTLFVFDMSRYSQTVYAFINKPSLNIEYLLEINFFYMTTSIRRSRYGLLISTNSQSATLQFHYDLQNSWLLFLYQSSWSSNLRLMLNRSDTSAFTNIQIGTIIRDFGIVAKKSHYGTNLHLICRNSFLIDI